jgi:hypothetical protein
MRDRFENHFIDLVTGISGDVDPEILLHAQPHRAEGQPFQFGRQ